MEKKTTIDKRISEQKDKMLEYLAESGNVSFACKKLGIVRKTFYRWKEDDPEFSHESDIAIASGKSFVNDLAHTQLIRKIQEGDMQAVRFQLVSCHPDYQKTVQPISDISNRMSFARIAELEIMRKDIQSRLSE